MVAWGVSLVATVAVLLPALAPGVVLSYDMVFTPDQPLVLRSVGVDSQLPRAVPVDAVVAAIDEVLPGALLQKAALVGALLFAGAGAGLLSGRLAAQHLRVRPGTIGGEPVALGAVAAAVAAGAAVVNPWVAGRLVIGHWSLLVAYACLPWLARAAHRSLRRERGAGPVLVLLLALSAITPTGGLLGLLVTGAVLAAGGGLLRHAWLLLVAAVVNAPWWVPGVLHPAHGGVSGEDAGVAEFALRSESLLGPWVSAVGLGGIWNAEVVTPGRSLVPVQLASLTVLGLAAAGAAAVRSRRVQTAGWLLTGMALLLALPATLPVVGVPAVTALVDAVPGGGILRDGHKWLALLAPVVAVGAGLGAARCCAALVARGRVGDRRTLPPLGIAALGLALVVATVPDALLGVGGRLTPSHYPDDWSRVAEVLDGEDLDDAVAVLPFQPFRTFDWTHRRTVLDPAPRWFGQQVVTDDRLSVGRRTLAGEGTWAERVRPVLESDGSAQDLADAGIEWVLVEHGTPGTVPQGWRDRAEVVVDGRDLSLHRLPATGESASDPPKPPAPPVLIADAMALGTVLFALAMLLSSRTRGQRVGAPRRWAAMLLSSRKPWASRKPRGITKPRGKPRA